MLGMGVFAGQASARPDTRGRLVVLCDPLCSRRQGIQIGLDKLAFGLFIQAQP